MRCMIQSNLSSCEIGYVYVCVCVCTCVCYHSVVSNSLWPHGCSLLGSMSMGFPRQEYWNGLSFPSLGDLPNPGIDRSPALQADSFFFFSIYFIFFYFYCGATREAHEMGYLQIKGDSQELDFFVEENTRFTVLKGMSWHISEISHYSSTSLNSHKFDLSASVALMSQRLLYISHFLLILTYRYDINDTLDQCHGLQDVTTAQISLLYYHKGKESWYYSGVKLQIYYHLFIVHINCF